MKYVINPWEKSIEGTICATLRAIWREADAVQNQTIKDLAAEAFDKAKRMDGALRKYRKRYALLPQEIRDELNLIGEDECIAR